MKIGIWISEKVEKHSGGSYNYLNTLTDGIDNFTFNPLIEIVFISLNELSDFNKSFIYLKPHLNGITFFEKVIRRILKLISKEFFKHTIDFIDQKEKKIKDASATSYLKNEEIKIIFYPAPASHVITGIPYILNNWDLAHYTTYAFPEITHNNGFCNRNDWYVNIMPSALMIFSETDTGKKELSTYLNLNADKIKTLPIFSSNRFINTVLSIDKQQAILKNIGLQKQQFFFYPAQFWAHKNHFTLIKAFKKLCRQHDDFKLVLCGSDKGNLAYIKTDVNTLGLNDNVIFSGFIDDAELYTLYKNAIALIMPTFLGPSNIPPIEALQLGCPVLCSDLDGHKEILGNSALYFNPLDDLSILECMKAIMDNKTRTELLKKQKEQSVITNHTIEKSLIKLNKHLIEAINIRNCWD